MGTHLARSTAGAAAVLGLVLTALGVYALAGSGASVSVMLESFGLTNLAVGISLLSTGTVLAIAKPQLVIGWLFQGAGLCYLLSAAALAFVIWPGHNQPLLPRNTGPAAAAMFYAGWPLGIGLLVPLALLSFPEGRLRGPATRIVAAAAVVSGLGFWIAFALYPGEENMSNGIGLTPEQYGVYEDVWALAQMANLVIWLAVCVKLIVEYYRGGEQVKRQMLWLIFSLLAAMAISLPFTVFGVGGVSMLAALVLLPAGVMIAVLRHRLLDIRVANSRTLVWLLLAGIVLAADLLLVRTLTPVLAPRMAPVAIAALVVALAAEPLRRALQRSIDCLVFGRRSAQATAKMMRERIVEHAEVGQLARDAGVCRS